MNRRQKIIVSVTGIFLVLLLLVGLTYAYFLTRITGNTNDKSISVSTANLAIVYGNDDGSVIGEGEKITPGTTFEPKTFTVTNQGNANTDYVVVIEDANVTYAETIEVDGVTQTAGTETTFESNDFTYTLTCESGCNGVSIPLTFPVEGGVLIGNRIDVNETQTYSFTLTYNETGKNQSNDMNKKLEAKINIIDITKDNPYKDNTSSLAYNIINNAILGTTGTTLVGTPETVPAVSISGYKGTGEYELATDFPGWDNITYGSTQEEANTGENTILEETAVEKCDSVINKYLYDKGTSTELGHVSDCAEDGTPYLEIKDYENVLSVAQDDLGVSYYYRGAVEDNYVTFADMCWRIVRIQGDGSVKLILEDQDQICGTSINGNWAIPTTTGGETYTGNFGYTQYAANTLTASDGTTNSGIKNIIDYLHANTNSDVSMATAFKNFQSTLTDDEKTRLKAGGWCLADDGYSRTGSSVDDYTYTKLTDIQKQDNKVKGPTFYYDSYVRLFGNNKDGYQATLKCNGTVMKDWDDNETNPTPMYVGAITADEVVFAGGKAQTSNKNYYLINEEFMKGTGGENKASVFRTLSPSDFYVFNDRAFYVVSKGAILYNNVSTDTFAFRPSISLASSAVITEGNGTLESPYIIG